MTLSDSDIKGYLRNNFGIDPPTCYFADGLYTCPTREWFFGEYRHKLGLWYSGALPKVKWWQRLFRQDSWDCDDYADVAAVVARVLHRESGQPGSIAVGPFCYYRGGQTDDNHAIIMGVFGPNDIGFIEQLIRETTVEPDEKCTFYRI